MVVAKLLYHLIAKVNLLLLTITWYVVPQSSLFRQKNKNKIFVVIYGSVSQFVNTYDSLKTFKIHSYSFDVSLT